MHTDLLNTLIQLLVLILLDIIILLSKLMADISFKYVRFNENSLTYNLVVCYSSFSENSGVCFQVHV